MARTRMRKTLLVVGLGTVIGLGLLRMTSNDRWDTTLLESSSHALLAPFQAGLAYVTGQGEAMGQAVINYRQVKEENEALRRENGELRRENGLLRQYQLENLRMKEMLAFKEEKGGNYQMIAARVIGRETSTWFRSLTLDQGAADGVEKDMVVINNDGLIGHVTSVSPHSCQVLLIIDREAPVPAMLLMTREPGIIEAKGDGSGLLQMVHLRRDAPVQDEQLVVTSGLGSLYPKGLRVGYVTGLEPEPNGLTKRAALRPAVDFQRLEEVFIVQKVLRQEGE
ncbi:rod shape-determining protein MreC [Heliobacterium undosum]|uniref:Cell shape-determining protein MreC n=1 Tax=Heliomicrobium undosum TaxID=121734 RepID=A0A845L0Y8_9FIRM|nr:rod shape-determining protein MreC [Heliomicrobium undosum]MZP30147.1 rod shape-determining protein MreC [Heliomicrobium undosum]